MWDEDPSYVPAPTVMAPIAPQTVGIGYAFAYASSMTGAPIGQVTFTDYTGLDNTGKIVGGGATAMLYVFAYRTDGKSLLAGDILPDYSVMTSGTVAASVVPVDTFNGYSGITDLGGGLANLPAGTTGLLLTVTQLNTITPADSYTNGINANVASGNIQIQSNSINVPISPYQISLATDSIQYNNNGVWTTFPSSFASVTDYNSALATIQAVYPAAGQNSPPFEQSSLTGDDTLTDPGP